MNLMSRSSRPEVFCKKGFLRNFTKFTWKHLCQSLFFNKVTGWNRWLQKLFSRRGFYKVGITKDFADFTGKYLCWSYSINLNFDSLLKLTSHGILRYLWSADLLINLLKLFSIDYINIYLFSTSFSIEWKVWGYYKLLTLWFINWFIHSVFSQW